MTYKDYNIGDWIGFISGAIEDMRELDGNEMRDLVEFLTKQKSVIEDIKSEINLLSDSEQIDLHTVEITNWSGMRNKVLDIINKHIEGDRE